MWNGGNYVWVETATSINYAGWGDPATMWWSLCSSIYRSQSDWSCGIEDRIDCKDWIGDWGVIGLWQRALVAPIIDWNCYHLRCLTKEYLVSNIYYPCYFTWCISILSMGSRREGLAYTDYISVFWILISNELQKKHCLCQG